MDSPWPTVAPEAVTDRVYQAIRDRILRGGMAPGSFVRQQELSRAMGVSRTPVREALMRLVSDGYVERVHRRGFRIATQSIQDLVALYPILAALEALACTTSFPRLDRTDFVRLRRRNRELRRALHATDPTDAVRINQEFHGTLSAKCGNARLIAMLLDLGGQIGRLERWSYSNEPGRLQTLADHEAIVAALERKDFASARKALEWDRMSASREYQKAIG